MTTTTRRPSLRGPRVVLAACLSGLLLAAPAQSAPGAELVTSEVLAQARAALGIDRLVQHPGAVRMRGSARMRGTDARQTDTFDGRGRRLQEFEGPLTMATGFDGTTAWSVDWNRTPRVLELGDRVTADLTADLLYGTWVDDEGLVFGEARDLGQRLELDFEDAAGTLSGSVQLDASTHLPLEVSWTSGSTTSTWTYAKFEDHDGFRFPGRLTMVASGSTQSLETRSIEFLEEVADDLYAPRMARAEDVHFDADVPSSLKLHRAPSGHLLVRAEVDGQDLGWFIFDTGAGTNCISTAVADRLAEGPFGEIPAQGIGGIVTSNLWRADSLRVGPMTLEDPIFLGLDLEFLNAPMGVEVAGILGYELISRCVVEFDLGAPSIALFDPGGYELRDAGTWQEVFLYQRHPNVRASFEGHEGIFKIDTGAARGSVMFHAPTVRRLELDQGRESTPATIGGVGGQLSVLRAELSSFELAGHRFGPLQVELVTSDQGALADPHVAGTMGGQVFDPFLLVFDYGRKRVGFVPVD